MKLFIGQVVQVREDGGQEHPAVVMEIREDLARVVGGTSHGSHRGLEPTPRKVRHVVVEANTPSSRSMGLPSKTFFYADWFRWERPDRFRMKGSCRPEVLMELQELDPLREPKEEA